MKPKTIDDFLSQYPKQGTKNSYRSGVYLFLDFCYGPVRSGGRATKDDMKKYEELNERYYAEERGYLDDLIQFVAWMDGRPPSTIKLKIAGVKEWMIFNKIDFTERELKRLRNKIPKAKGSWTDEKDFDKELLKQIIAHMGEKGKALILLLASSGMRISEALQIKLNDLDLSTDPPEINVRGDYTKGGERRTVFISKEAKSAIEEWLKVRGSYLKSAVNRNKGLIGNGDAKAKSIDDDRIFPFSDTVVREFWSRALDKTGLHMRDKTTGLLKYRIHGLRKFFRSQLALTCPVDIVEALMGHEGYLTDAYRRYTTKQMGEYYLKAEHHITIFESGDLAEIQEKLQDTSATVEGYKNIVTGQADEMAKMRREMEDLKSKLDGIQKVDELLDMIFEKILTDEDKKKQFKEILSSIL